MVLAMNVKDEESWQKAVEVHDALNAAGIDTLLDDRDERAGVKFKDADLSAASADRHRTQDHEAGRYGNQAPVQRRNGRRVLRRRLDPGHPGHFGQGAVITVFVNGQWPVEAC